MTVQCEICGISYSPRELGRRCMDRSWYDGPYRDAWLPMPCPGRCVAHATPIRYKPYQGTLAPAERVATTLEQFEREA